MDVKRVSDTYSITSQIESRDLPIIHAMGFKSVLCTRLDDEEIDQPLSATIETSARHAGMAFELVPVSSDGIDEKALKSFVAAYERLPKPILAYSQTGGRSAELYERMTKAA